MSEVPPDVESLRLLVLVGELGSLGQAAERMGISQPAASRRLSALERRLRLGLVNRTKRGSALTVEGKAVCQWAGRVFAELDSLRSSSLRTTPGPTASSPLHWTSWRAPR
jgi:DNA-binding transcriptional LysR family regulator